MTADLTKIPGVGGKRRRSWSPRRYRLAPLPTTPAGAAFWAGAADRRRPSRRPLGTRVRDLQWGSVAVAAGCVAVGGYVAVLVWSATRVDVEATGVVDKATLTSEQFAGHTVRFDVRPADRARRAELRLDSRLLPKEAFTLEGSTIVWPPGRLPEGNHRISLVIPRPAMPDSRFAWQVQIDDSPPRLEVQSLQPAAAVCKPVTVSGRVERGVALTVDGRPLRHDGSFALRFDRPPPHPLHLVATDKAGNTSEAHVIVPTSYPGGQGVHATAAAWGYEPLRRGILDLVDSGLVSIVQLDLKDEGGIVGYDSKVALAHQIGAVQPEYRLREVVIDLKGRGVRVIGRIVSFKDPQLASWAWANNRRDWVVQTKAGGPLPGGFVNHTDADVRRYNLDLAMEAADAGMDDILWDYMRRPEGDPETMVIPGLRTTSADSIVEFLTSSRAALRERCVFQGVSVFGIAADRPDTVGQDVPRIARQVDYIAPMLYPSHWVPGEYRVANPNAQPGDIVRAALADFQAKVAGTGAALVPWLQDFSLGHPYGPREVRAQIDAAGSLGVSDWLLWNAGARYTSGALDRSLVGLRP